MKKNLIILIIVAVLATIMYIVSGYTKAPPTIACTQEALICPDGSSVGRVGPKCEFAPCPKINKVVSPTIDSVEKTFCGGIKGTLCPTGYECVYDGKYPDAGGNCVKVTPKPN
ncbi:MAG: hypothetical protein WC744_03035 [Patescibacteria group bacterium]|jgi:hypothetical protein